VQHISHYFVGYIFRTIMYIYRQSEKLVKQQYLPHMTSQYGELRPTSVESGSLVWASEQISRGIGSWLRSLLQRVATSLKLTEANQTLHYVWPFPGLVHYIHFRGLLPLREFCQVQNSLCVQVLLLHSPTIGSVTARHSSSGRQPKFAAWYTEWNY